VGTGLVATLDVTGGVVGTSAALASDDGDAQRPHAAPTEPATRVRSSLRIETSWVGVNVHPYRRREASGQASVITRRDNGLRSGGRSPRVRADTSCESGNVCA